MNNTATWIGVLSGVAIAGLAGYLLYLGLRDDSGDVLELEDDEEVTVTALPSGGLRPPYAGRVR